MSGSSRPSPDPSARSGGIENVSSGGVTSYTLVSSGGIENVSSGAVAIRTLVRGSSHVYSAGIARWTSVGIGGYQFVSSGGIASNTWVHAGSAVVSSGGVLSAVYVSSGGSATIYNGAILSGAILDSGTLAFSLGGAGSTTVNGSVTDPGILSVNGGSVVLAAAFTNNGSAIVGSGTLEFGDIVSASAGHSGSLVMQTSGTLLFNGVVTSGETVSFGIGSMETLELQGPGGFAAAISGFPTSASASDQIEIVGKVGLTDSYSGTTTSGTLTVSSGATPIAHLKFIGDYTSSAFLLTSSGGNTFITDPTTASGFSLAAVASAAGVHVDLANVGHFDTAVRGGGTVLNLGPTGHGGASPLVVLPGVATDPAMVDHRP